MNNTQFLTSRIYRPTDRRFLLYGLPFLFSVHPIFTAVTALDEQITKKPETGVEIFTSTQAIQSAEDGLRSTFTNNLALVPLAVCMVCKVHRIYSKRRTFGMI